MQIYNSLDEVVEAGTIAPDSIVNADCLEAMKFIPDKSIDCIICDLPYGVTALKWDVVIPFDLLWEQYKRIIKPNGAIVLFGSQPFTSALVMSNPKWFKYEWIWEKDSMSNPALAKIQPLKYHENILIFCKGKTVYKPQMWDAGFTSNQPSKTSYLGSSGFKFVKSRREQKTSTFRYPKSIVKFNKLKHNSGRGIEHPTQKPVSLIEYLAKTYTLENELILDNTAGSGTLAIAAINTNRRYICIEKDPDYFEVMRDRIENHDPKALATPKKTRKPRAIPEGQLALFG